jgi:hypothetical protein
MHRLVPVPLLLLLLLLLACLLDNDSGVHKVAGAKACLDGANLLRIPCLQAPHVPRSSTYCNARSGVGANGRSGSCRIIIVDSHADSLRRPAALRRKDQLPAIIFKYLFYSIADE